MRKERNLKRWNLWSTHFSNFLFSFAVSVKQRISNSHIIIHLILCIILVEPTLLRLLVSEYQKNTWNSFKGNYEHLGKWLQWYFLVNWEQHDWWYKASKLRCLVTRESARKNPLQASWMLRGEAILLHLVAGFTFLVKNDGTWLQFLSLPKFELRQLMHHSPVDTNWIKQ